MSMHAVSRDKISEDRMHVCVCIPACMYVVNFSTLYYLLVNAESTHQLIEHMVEIYIHICISICVCTKYHIHLIHDLTYYSIFLNQDFS